MATMVRPRPAPKEAPDQKEAARERRQATVEEERDKWRETEKTKKKLRLIASQKCKTEEEAAKSLDEIHKMTPEQANSRLDVLMARADLTLLDKIASHVKTGMSAILDFTLKAEGCIANRFDLDEALQQALVDELGFAASFISNKVRIALCVSSDTLAGFQDARKNKKQEKKDEKTKDIPEHDGVRGGECSCTGF
jgi:hypothetical protein